MADAAFIESLQKNKDLRQMVVGMLAQDYSNEDWQGAMTVPPGSILDDVMTVFREETDIPLELIAFSLFHFMSGYLLSKQVTINGQFGTSFAELWTIVLAESGSGKSLSHDTIASCSAVKSDFPEPSSAAKFIDSFQDHNFHLMFIDEVAQLLKNIEKKGGPLADMKKYLLCAYSNQKIERANKVETITIDTPCIGILGLNTPESFYNTISPESLLDGFAQRFSYVLAEPDPERSVYDNPLKYANYNIQKIKEVVQRSFDRFYELNIHDSYTVSPEALQAYTIAFASLIHKSIPISFFRRVLHRAYKYSLIYHLLLEKQTNIIDGEDVAWACRIANKQLQDLKYLINRNEVEDMGSLLKKAQKVKERFDAANRPFNARVLQQNVRGLDAASAKVLFEMLI